MKQILTLCGVMVLASLMPAAGYADTAALVRDQCSGCHALEKPDYEGLGVAERSTRKAPALYYAGNKFRLEWLEAWLQQPTLIRPAGVSPIAHVRTSADGDVIDASTLGEHPALAPEDAAAVAQYLVQLRPFDDLIAAQNYEPGSIALRMGQMNFSKFKGCDACHRDAPDRGGLSGPELFTAWNRLQPAFITAFIADPTAWDPHALMPNAHIKDTEVEKLANYLKALQEEQP